MNQKENLEKLVAEFIESASILMPGVHVSIDLKQIDPHDLSQVNNECSRSYIADSHTGEVTYKLSSFKWLDSEMKHALHLSSKKINVTPINS